jgi:hypothetical protein
LNQLKHVGKLSQCSRCERLPVKTYFLTPEELKAYREKNPSHVKKKEKRVQDWRWSQNRSKNKKSQA